MKKYGLTGNPLSHSMSAIIHNEILKIKNVDGEYTLYPDENLSKSFEEILSKLNGFNITIPYKKDIIKYLDELSDKVKLYNSCNTVKIENGKTKGYNTDVFGIHDTLKKNNVELFEKRVLVLGNGGVSSMIACECALCDAEVSLLCRDNKKGEILKKEIFDKTGKTITLVTKEELKEYDILINGTPVGMYPDTLNSFFPLSKLKDIPVVFDTIYNPYETLLVRVSNYYGNKGISGLNMLVEQAIKAQEIFNGIALSKEEFDFVLNKAKESIHPFKISKNIILIGAPGCGKTTISREIASLLSVDFTDIDEEIEKREEKTINEIFDKNGQEYFRKKEKEVFSDTLKEKGKVISTGGGLPEYVDLSKINKEENIIVYLDVAKEVIINRIKDDNKRPLLKNGTDALTELLQRRKPIYEKSLDIRIIVEKEKNIKDIAVEILDNILTNHKM